MPGDSRKLQDLIEMVQENNRLLRKMRRGTLWGIAFKIILYSLMLGVPVYVYLSFFQPIMGNVLDTISKVQNAGGQIQNTANSFPIEKIKEVIQIFTKKPL